MRVWQRHFIITAVRLYCQYNMLCAWLIDWYVPDPVEDRCDVEGDHVPAVQAGHLSDKHVHQLYTRHVSFNFKTIQFIYLNKLVFCTPSFN